MDRERLQGTIAVLAVPAAPNVGSIWIASHLTVNASSGG